MPHVTKKEAQALIASKLADSNLTILEASTIEKPWGWVFFYQSVQFLKTGNPSHQLAGNAPTIVNRFSAEIRTTGTAYPVERYIADYENSLESDAV